MSNSVGYVNTLGPELSAQKTQDLNGWPLLCMFLATNFSECSDFSASQCTWIVIDFWWQKVK